ncbi:MAG: exodeoxyribonuclease III [Phycisphaerales bacterium]
MRVITWNINSVRARLPRLVDVLRRHDPDVVCLQETKTSNATFPSMAVGSLGYRLVLYGQPSYNGVAILVRDPSRRGDLATFTNGSREADAQRPGLGFPTGVICGFAGNPVPNEARVVSACVGGLRIVNAYVVNGSEIGSDIFHLKGQWMESFGRWLRQLPKDPPILVLGDFNVAPDDRDVWDPEGLRHRIHCTPEERAWLLRFQGDELHDLLRVVSDNAGHYTWWPYQRGAFERDEGLRFDLALGDKRVASRVINVWVDHSERRVSPAKEPPSDHAPLILDLAA